MPTIADLSVKYSADTSNFESGTNKVQGLISGLTSGAKGLATVAGGFLLAQGVQKLIGGMGDLAGAGLSFEKELANINSVLQDDSAVKKYGDALIQLSKDPRVLAGPTELAAGFYNVASAGFTGQGALDVMTAAAMAATAGMTTADVAAGAIAGTMNAYGQNTYTAAQVSDALFGAVAAGSVTFEALAANLGNTTSLASTMGVSINELASAYAVMSNNNISAAQAETQIAAVMRSAANPTKQLTEALTAHGYATAEAAIASEGFGGFIDLVTAAAGGNKAALFDMLGTQEAVNAALILGADGGEQYADVLADITKGTKEGTTTQKALEKQMTSASYKIAEARKQVQIAATLFTGVFAPAIGMVAAGFSTLVQRGTEFAQTFVKMMSPAADFGAWLQSVPGWAQPVVKLLADMYQAGGDLVDAFQDFKDGDYAGAFRELREAADTALDGLVGFGQTVWDNVVGALSNVDWPGVWSTFTSGLVALASAGIDLGTMIVNGALALGSAILGGAKDLWGWFKNKIGAGTLVGDGTGGPEPGQEIPLGTVLVSGALKLWGDLKDAAGGLWNWVKGKLFGGNGLGAIPVLGGVLGGNQLDLGDILLKAAFKIGNLLTSVGTVLDSLSSKIQQKVTDLDWERIFSGTDAQGFGERFGKWVGDSLDGLDASDLIGGALNLQTKIMQGVGAAVTGAFALNGAAWGTLLGAVSGFFKGLVTSVQWDNIGSTISSKLGSAFQTASDTVTQKLQGISDAIGRILGKASDAISTALGPVKSAFDDITGALQNLIDLYNTAAGFFGLPTIGGGGGGGSVLGGLGKAGTAIATAIGQHADPNQAMPGVYTPDSGTPGEMGGGKFAPRVDTKTFAQGIGTLPTITKTTTAQLPTVFTQAIQPFLTTMKQQAVDAVKQWGAQSGLGGLTPATQKASISTIGAFSTSMAPIGGAAGDAAGGAVTGFGGGIAPLPGNAGSVAGQAHTLFGAGIAPMPGTALGTAGKTAASLASGIAPMPGQAGQTGSQVTGQFGSAIAPLPGQAGATARNTSGQFNSGISVISQAVGLARSAASNIQSAMAGAGSGAYGYGYSIGAQFAAGLNASLSLVAGAAASLRNLMPSSPAKEGPLSKPISWQYILDDLEDTMGRLPGAARRGMQGTARELGRSGSLAYSARTGSLGGGQVVNNHYTVIALKSDELQRILKQTEQGARAFAQMQPRERERQLGSSRG